MNQPRDIGTTALALALAWVGGEHHTYPGIVPAVRSKHPALAHALDMLVSCGPTKATLDTLDTAWTAITRNGNGDTEDIPAVIALDVDWPQLTAALIDVASTPRTGQP